MIFVCTFLIVLFVFNFWLRFFFFFLIGLFFLKNCIFDKIYRYYFCCLCSETYVLLSYQSHNEQTYLSLFSEHFFFFWLNMICTIQIYFGICLVSFLFIWLLLLATLYVCEELDVSAKCIEYIWCPLFLLYFYIHRKQVRAGGLNYCQFFCGNRNYNTHQFRWIVL